MLIKRKGRERNKSEEMEAEEGSGLSDRKAGPKWQRRYTRGGSLG